METVGGDEAIGYLILTFLPSFPSIAPFVVFHQELLTVPGYAFFEPTLFLLGPVVIAILQWFYFLPWLIRLFRFEKIVKKNSNYRVIPKL